MAAKVLNIIFALANVVAAAFAGGPALIALAQGYVNIVVLWYLLLGSGLMVSVVAMLYPHKLTGVSIHILALGFLAPLHQGLLYILNMVISMVVGSWFEAFLALFFTCSMAWSLWFVYQLVRIRKAQIRARRVISR